MFGFLNYKIYLKTKLDLMVQSYNLSTWEPGPGELYSETFFIIIIVNMTGYSFTTVETHIQVSMRVTWERFN